MAIDEQYLRVRRSLEEKLGVEEASYLMDRPVGGWSALVTNHTLDLKFAVLEERFRGTDARFTAIDARFTAIDQRFQSLEERLDDRFAALEHKLVGVIERRIRVQTWTMVTALFAAMGMLGAFLKL